jgi:hypothetical protein
MEPFAVKAILNGWLLFNFRNWQKC